MQSVSPDLFEVYESERLATGELLLLHRRATFTLVQSCRHLCALGSERSNVESSCASPNLTGRGSLEMAIPLPDHAVVRVNLHFAELSTSSALDGKSDPSRLFSFGASDAFGY